MKNVKAGSGQGTPPLYLSEEHDAGRSALLFQAIENADGVPFQLIFGQSIGEGYYIRIGKGIEDLLGIVPADFTEKKYHEMVEEVVPLTGNIPSDPVEARKMMLSGELSTYRTEVRVTTASGEKKWIRDTSLTYADSETGRIIGVFGILTDITDFKNSRLAVSQARKNAEEYDRLKTAFLQNISHEIRTPLNAIVGFSTLLCEETMPAGRQQEYQDIILQSTDHLLRVMTDIVEMSKLESGMVTLRKDSVDIRVLLEDLYNSFSARTAEKGIGLKFTYKTTENGELIEADIQKVNRLLERLLENAVKFTKEGRIEFGCEIKEGEAEFYVSDTGPGIAEEHRGEVFTRFYQAETTPSRSYGGIGLGLTIVREYISLMGGKIWFTTKVGEGTQFRFTIPVNI